MKTHASSILAAVSVSLAPTTAAQDAAVQGWDNWRGPNKDAVAPAGNPPTQWSEADGKNIKWKITLPGKGSSSPIVWKDRIYVTSAVETDKGGEGAQPEAGGARRGRGGFGGERRGGGRGRGGAPTKVHDFVVLAYDRHTGEEAWHKTVKSVVPHAGHHGTGTQASNSPLTDGERIYAFFGSRGVHCLDMDGAPKWSKDLGRMTTRNSFGEGASPALHGDTLVVNWDHEGDSFIVALDKKTGEQRWKTARDEATTWTTPLIVEVDGRAQVIVSATRASRSYDLETGELVWTCKGMTANCISSPIHADGVVYLMSGHRGNKVQAIRLAGAEGDLTGSDKVLWSYEGTNTPYTPSGLVVGGNVYFLRRNDGILTCLDAKTGESRYEAERLRGLRSVYSSLVAVGDRMYITGREGTTKVIKLGDEPEEIATNRVDDTVDATAAIVGDALYLRGWSKLYCIAASGE